MIRQICVVYDDRCGFCCQCARWLAAQPKLVHVECIAQSDPRIGELQRDLPALPRAELTVLDDQGGVYFGDSAWLMAMWSLQAWRPWSERFATPTLRPLARQAFGLISASRHGINGLFGLRSEAEIVAAMRRIERADGETPCGEACSAS
ncbi:hypothetical protein LBMAG42_10040 [Deltaproteobacteria bacterium]|nr:hypothetical protein LBMAG42_10040 [Deltaproteobacteria bacterium]